MKASSFQFRKQGRSVVVFDASCSKLGAGDRSIQRFIGPTSALTSFPNLGLHQWWKRSSKLQAIFGYAEGVAMKWFSGLPPRSITSFANLAAAFES
ncbi:hypothetical protein CR513_15201, partial [Mucuna pruriens]